MSKVESIKAIEDPTKLCDICWSVGIVNYYRDMWRKRAHTLSPLTKILSTKVNFKGTEEDQNGFMKMKRILGIDSLPF